MKISTLIFTSIRESFKTVILESLKIVEDEKNNILEFLDGLSNTRILHLYLTLESSVTMSKNEKIKRYQRILKLQDLFKKTVLPIASITPGSFETLTAYYFLRNAYNYKCQIQCLKEGRLDRFCYHRCNIKSIRDIIQDLEVAITQCRKVEVYDPGSCMEKLLKQLGYWKSKQVGAERKYQDYLANRRGKK